jgi:hypothetical protein
MDSYIAIIEVNGKRLPVPEIVDWCNVEDGYAPEELADEYEEYVRENENLLDLDDAGHWSLRFEAYVGDEHSDARTIKG